MLTSPLQFFIYCSMSEQFRLTVRQLFSSRLLFVAQAQATFHGGKRYSLILVDVDNLSTQLGVTTPIATPHPIQRQTSLRPPLLCGSRRDSHHPFIVTSPVGSTKKTRKSAPDLRLSLDLPHSAFQRQGEYLKRLSVTRKLLTGRAFSAINSNWKKTTNKRFILVFEQHKRNTLHSDKNLPPRNTFSTEGYF